MNTLEQLRRRYDRPCLPLNEVRAEYLPHLNLETLLEKIKKGEIKLRYTRLDPSRRAHPVVYLSDLAAWLDALQPAADQAA